MDSSGYYLRQRPLSVAVSTKNLTFSTTHSLATTAHSTRGTGGTNPTPTMSSSCQENLGADSEQGITTVAKPFHPPAAFPRGNLMTAANVVTTTVNADFPNFPTVSANVDFLQNVQSNFVSAVTSAVSVNLSDFPAAVANVSSVQNNQLNFANFPAIVDNVDFAGNAQRAGNVNISASANVDVANAAQNAYVAGIFFS